MSTRKLGVAGAVSVLALGILAVGIGTAGAGSNVRKTVSVPTSGSSNASVSQVSGTVTTKMKKKSNCQTGRLVALIKVSDGASASSRQPVATSRSNKKGKFVIKPPTPPAGAEFEPGIYKQKTNQKVKIRRDVKYLCKRNVSNKFEIGL